MSKNVVVKTTCNKCGAKLQVNTTVEETKIDVTNYPEVSCKNLKPISNILVYRITSEDIKNYITEKSRLYVTDVRVTLIPRYCEKKRKNDKDPIRSYASLIIAFSDNVLEKKDEYGWYGRIGENNSNVKIHSSVMKNIVDKYSYKPEQVSAWMKNYKILEELEDTLGMTESYINELYTYSTPQRVKVQENGEYWILFSAAAENVIADMLLDKNTKKKIGRIQIKEVQSISDTMVEYIVYVHPEKTEVRENPHVRQILLGDGKFKK